MPNYCDNIQLNAYIQFYYQTKAMKAGDIQEMKHNLEMLSTSSTLGYLRYRLNNTKPWFEGLVPDDGIDPYENILMWIRFYKMPQNLNLKPFAESAYEWEDQIVGALEKAIDEEAKWERWFLDPKIRAANCIKRAWRKAIDNPNTKVGKNHLRRDFENFQVKFSTDFV